MTQQSWLDEEPKKPKIEKNEDENSTKNGLEKVELQTNIKSI